MTAVSEHVELAWDRDTYLVHYFNQMIGYAINRHHRRGLAAEDLEDIAMDALFDSADIFAAMIAEQELREPQAYFVGMVRKRIDWGVMNELKARRKRAYISMDERFGEDELVHSLLNAHDLARYRAPSVLHHVITDAIAVLPTRWKLLLAFRFHEEMGMPEVGKLMGSSTGEAGKLLGLACTNILETAVSEVVDHPEPLEFARTRPWEIPEAVHRWVWTNTSYLDVHYYLGTVQRDYELDVRYAIDIIDRAHGRGGPRFGNRGISKTECGSRRGRKRHLDAGEPVCAPCQEAADRHRQQIRDWHAKQRREARTPED